MGLTRNERKILKMLLDNSRISDREISDQLRITSQAVGKIRRKLEDTVIESYTMNLDCSKLNIRMFAMGVARLTNEGSEIGELEVERKLKQIPHVMNVYRVTSGKADYIILYGFRDLNELDCFFHCPEMKGRIHNLIKNQDLFTFSNHGMIKNNPIQLFRKVVDDMSIKPLKINF